MVVQEEIQKLNRKILNQLENEITVFKDNHPHLQLEALHSDLFRQQTLAT